MNRDFTKEADEGRAFIQTLVGKEVEFLEMIEELEDYAMPGMRATVLGFKTHDAGTVDEFYEVRVSYAKYEDRNENFETHDFYLHGPEGGTGSAREAGMYSAEANLYIMAANLTRTLKIIDDGALSLIDEFKASGSANYVSFLEALVLKARAGQ